MELIYTTTNSQYIEPTIEIVPTSLNPPYSDHIDRDRSYKQKFTEQRPVT